MYHQRINLALSLLVFTLVASGQYFPENEGQSVSDKIDESAVVPETTIFLTLSSGINNYTGLFGFGGEVSFADKIGARVGLGVGGYGSKISGGLKFGDQYRNGWNLGMTVSTVSGVKDFDMEFEDQTVNLDLKRLGSFNLTAIRNWFLKGGNKAFLELGYAVTLGSSDFYTVNDGSTLTDEEIFVLKIIRPGGIVIGAGFMLKI